MPGTNERARPSTGPTFDQNPRPSPRPRGGLGSLWRTAEGVYALATDRLTRHLPEPRANATPEVVWDSYDRWAHAFVRTRQLWRQNVARKFTVATPDDYLAGNLPEPFVIQGHTLKEGIELPPEFQIAEMYRISKHQYPNSNHFRVGVVPTHDGTDTDPIIVILHEELVQGG